jgi:hypothetical protein
VQCLRLQCRLCRQHPRSTLRSRLDLQRHPRPETPGTKGNQLPLNRGKSSVDIPKNTALIEGGIQMPISIKSGNTRRKSPDTSFLVQVTCALRMKTIATVSCYSLVSSACEWWPSFICSEGSAGSAQVGLPTGAPPTAAGRHRRCYGRRRPPRSVRAGLILMTK